MGNPKNRKKTESRPTETNDFEAEFEQGAWWWRRLVFAELVKPIRKSAERKPHEYETIRRSQEFLRSVIGPSHSSEFRVDVMRMSLYEFSEWKDGLERGAFNYELLRRHPEHDEFRDLLPWPEISLLEYSWYSGGLRKRQRSIAKKQHPQDPDPSYSTPLDFQWDLTRTDNALCEHFLLLIHQERKRNGLIGDRCPEYLRIKGKLKLVELDTLVKANKDTKKKREERPVSWRTVELLDLQSRRDLDDNEKKAVKQTLRRLEPDLIADFKDVMMNAASDSSELPSSNAFDHNRNPIWRWLRENLPIWEQSLPN